MPPLKIRIFPDQVLRRVEGRKERRAEAIAELRKLSKEQRGDILKELIGKYSTSSPVERMELIANDIKYPPEYYPVEWVNLTTEEKVLALANKFNKSKCILDVKKEEALVSVLTVKDTVFNHYLEVQGSVDTKENIVVQPSDKIQVPYPVATMKRCTGFTDLYKKSFTLPLWADAVISSNDQGEFGYKFKNGDCK